MERNTILILVLSIASNWIGGMKMNYFYHFVCVHMQVVIIYGLTVETENMAWFTRLCRMRMTRFLGKVSLAVYLLHLIVKEYSYLLYKSLTGINDDSSLRSVCDENSTPGHECHWMFLFGLPTWTIPINTVLTIFLATYTYKFFEEPLRSWLKAKTSPQKTEI